MQFVLNRDKTVATRTGHAIHFKKGEPTYVPKEAWAEVQVIGAIPEEEIPEAELPHNDTPTNPEDRKVLILAAFEEIIGRNQREDFTAGGQPHARVVSDIVGFNVDAKERDAFWTAYTQRNKDD